MLRPAWPRLNLDSQRAHVAPSLPVSSSGQSDIQVKSRPRHAHACRCAVLFLASNVVWWRWRFQHTWHSLEYVFGFYLMVVRTAYAPFLLPMPLCSPGRVLLIASARADSIGLDMGGVPLHASQVWLVPFALFISLAANEQTLPGTASGLPYGGAAAGVHLAGRGLPHAPHTPGFCRTMGLSSCHWRVRHLQECLPLPGCIKVWHLARVNPKKCSSSAQHTYWKPGCSRFACPTVVRRTV